MFSLLLLGIIFAWTGPTNEVVSLKWGPSSGVYTNIILVTNQTNYLVYNFPSNVYVTVEGNPYELFYNGIDWTTNNPTTSSFTNLYVTNILTMSTNIGGPYSEIQSYYIEIPPELFNSNITLFLKAKLTIIKK